MGRNGTDELESEHFEYLEMGVCAVGLLLFFSCFPSSFVCYLGIFGVVGDLTSLLSSFVPFVFSHSISLVLFPLDLASGRDYELVFPFLLSVSLVRPSCFISSHPPLATRTTPHCLVALDSRFGDVLGK